MRDLITYGTRDNGLFWVSSSDSTRCDFYRWSLYPTDLEYECHHKKKEKETTVKFDESAFIQMLAGGDSDD